MKCAENVSAYFRFLGASYVYDTSLANAIAAVETSNELRSRIEADCHLPMLTSACPGWICYVEKTHPELIPLVSTTKSAQQIMGRLVKDLLARSIDRRLIIYRITGLTLLLARIRCSISV